VKCEDSDKDGRAEYKSEVKHQPSLITQLVFRPIYRGKNQPTCSEYDIQRILMLNNSASESTSGLRKGSCWCTNRIKYSMFPMLKRGYSGWGASFWTGKLCTWTISGCLRKHWQCTLQITESPENVQQGSLARFARQEVDFRGSSTSLQNSVGPRCYTACRCAINKSQRDIAWQLFVECNDL